MQTYYILIQWLSMGENFAPKEHLEMFGDIFSWWNFRGLGVPWHLIGRWRPGMLLTALQCTGQPPQQCCPAPDVDSTESEEPCFKVMNGATFIVQMLLGRGPRIPS